jgi:hypothetical protein
MACKRHSLQLIFVAQLRVAVLKAHVAVCCGLFYVENSYRAKSKEKEKSAILNFKITKSFHFPERGIFVSRMQTPVP